MTPVRIFISSPGDVAAEREKARVVIAELQKRYTGSLLLQPVFWEDLALGSSNSFQGGIDVILSSERGVDIAVFILWSRLGSPLGTRILKEDETEYRSGTEREWDLMLRARERSGGVRPDIFTYLREDQHGFIEAQRGKELPALRDMVDQRGKVQDFVAEHFTDRETGANTRAFFTFREPITFAHRLRTHLRARLDEMLVDADGAAVVWHPAEQGSPFRGLEVFEYEHAPLFFGREQEVCDLQIRLRQQDAAGCAFVLLVGASGSGKSSLARAGVAPAVAQYDREDDAAEWRRAVFTPGANPADPLLGLVHALAAPHALPELAREDLAELAGDLARDPEMAFRRVLRPLFTGNTPHPHHRRRLLLIFDQIEELFTHGEINAETQGRLAAALGVFARSGHVWVLGTIRSDYYARFQAVPGLLALKGEGAHVDLPPPALTELQRIITQPARAAGLRFEENERGERLDARLLSDAAAHPEALPLLEYCLDVLFQRQAERRDGVLRWADYEAMRGWTAAVPGGEAEEAAAVRLPDGGQPAGAAESGLAGALVSQAEAALHSLPAEHQRQCLNAVFGKLFDLSTGGRETPVRRTATEEELLRNPYPHAKGEEELPGASAFLTAFAARRLLVSGVTTAATVDGGEPRRTFTVAHEALLRNWWRLRRLQAEQAEFLRIRRQVEHAQADWLGAKQDDSFLLAEGLPLQLAKKLVAGAPELPTRELADFVTRSARRVERARRRRRRITAGVMAGLVLLTCLAVLAAITASRAKRNALAAAESERTQKQEAENRTNIAKQTTEFVTGMFERIDPAEAKGREITVREVLDQASKLVETTFPGQPSVELEIRLTFTDIYRKLGKFEQALIQAEACLRLAQQTHGEINRLYMATSLTHIAMCQQGLGRNAEALPKFEEALAMYQSLFKGDHFTVAQSLNNLAGCLQALGRSAEALPKFEMSFAMFRSLFRNDDPYVIQALNNLAYCLDESGRSAEALPKFEEALAMYQRLFKGDHPDVATSLMGVASCLDNLGRSAEALPKFEEALAMYQRLFKGDHPDVATSLNNVAHCLQVLDRDNEALPQFERALVMRQHLFHNNHPHVAQSLNSLAVCIQNLGRSAEALPKFEEALAMYQRLFQGDHSDVAVSLNNVAFCLNSLGRSQEALLRLEEALTMRQRLFKGDHSDVATSLANVAVCLNTLGRSVEARARSEEALAMLQRLYKGDHPDVASSFLNLGDCLHSLERTTSFENYQSGQLMLGRLGRRLQVQVTQVVPGGQGERLGVQVGDVFLQYAGEPIFTRDQFVHLTGRVKGRDLELKLRRGERFLTFKVQEGRIGCVIANETVEASPKPEKQVATPAPSVP